MAMIQPRQPAAAMVTRTVTTTDGIRPMRDFCRSATTGVKINVRMRANARGIRIWRAKYSAAMVANSMTIAQLLELGSWRCDGLVATGAEALRESAEPGAGPAAGCLGNNGRLPRKAANSANRGKPATHPDAQSALVDADSGNSCEHTGGGAAGAHHAHRLRHPAQGCAPVSGQPGPRSGLNGLCS